MPKYVSSGNCSPDDIVQKIIAAQEDKKRLHVGIQFPHGMFKERVALDSIQICPHMSSSARERSMFSKD